LALTPKDSETFYREVDEELRRSQLAGFFGRFGIAIAAAILLGLAIIGGVLWWQHYRQTQADEQAEKLTKIFDDADSGKTKDLDTRLDALAADGNDAYRAAALLMKADVAIKEGKDAVAIQAFGQVVKDDSLAQPYRDLALIRQTALEFDKLPPTQVIDRMKPLAVKGAPWFGSAGEMLAMAYMKQRKPDLAAPIFAAMAKDETVPRSIRSRATQMAASLGLEVAELPAPAAAQ
jgi:hypothetical protein